VGGKLRAFILTILLLGLTQSSWAVSPGILEEKAIMAIVGEAEGEPYAGKVALAYALKNRGKLDGVYGYKAISLRSGAFWRGKRKITPRTIKEAKNAWNWANSYPDLDPTKGADHWENIKAFGKPKWAYSMKETYRVGSHVFYREGT